MRKAAQHIQAIIWKDWLLERTTKQSISSMLIFGLIVIVTFSFAQDPFSNKANEVSMGLMWTTVWLMGTLGVNRTFSAETESRALDAILISPISRPALYFGKLISLFLTLAATELLLLPLFAIFFNRPFLRPAVIGILLLGTLGYVAAGVFVGSMAVQTRASYLLIPILMLPLTLPIVLAAAVASAEIIQPVPNWEAATPRLLYVLIYDLLMFIIGYLFYTYVVEE